MEGTKLGLLALGLVAGGAAAWMLKPDAVPAPAPVRDAQLVGGKYLVVHNDYGNWIYEKLDAGGFKLLLKEFTPLGLKTIWSLQAEFQPASLKTAKGDIVYVPQTQFGTDTGSFKVDNKYFQMTDTGLVEIPMTLLPPPPPKAR